MAQKNPMRRTGAAWLTVVMLVALYATVVRLESASAVSYPTSFTQARLPTTQRVQSLVIPACSFPSWNPCQLNFGCLACAERDSFVYRASRYAASGREAAETTFGALTKLSSGRVHKLRCLQRSVSLAHHWLLETKAVVRFCALFLVLLIVAGCEATSSC